MPHRNTLSRLTIASLAAVALAAPAASAQPIMDMHASTVQKPKPAKVDLRGEAAAGTKSAVDSKAGSAKADLRGEAASGAPSTTVSRPPLPGPPTWPMYPTPLPSHPAPVAADGGSDGGIDVPESVLIIAGTLVLGAGMGAVALRTRPRTGTVQ